MVAGTTKPTFAELYTPKLVTVLREGYGVGDLRADVIAGLTVAIVAVPLSMAIAIASGVSPDRGLYTAIVGGFFVSLLGGSRYQIGGPAGAFIVLVLATVQTHGLDGLILATFISGLMLTAIGLLRLGTYIKYIPFPVTVGFTAGIAVIIFASQIKELLGLTLTSEPGPLLDKLPALARALPTVNSAAVIIAVLTIATTMLLRRYRPHWPGMLIAVAVSAVVAATFALPVETIGTRFGGIPSALLAPHLPEWNLEKVRAVLPAAFSFALLGGIESLLSAVVADSMSGGRHRSNCELVAQGAANVASSLFGGFCVTGTIARTATNVRAGARGPIAGISHAGFVLAFMLVAAPLATYVPLASLAAVLAIVAWNMAERHAFATLLRATRGDAVVLMATFLLVVFRDLTEGILVGFGLGALLFLHRMAQSVAIDKGSFDGNGMDDRADSSETGPTLVSNDDIAVYRISGAFFFGAAAAVIAAIERLGGRPRAYVLDLSQVSILDSSAAAAIEGFVRKAHRQGAAIFVAAPQSTLRRTLLMHGVRPPRVKFRRNLADAIASANAYARESGRNVVPFPAART